MKPTLGMTGLLLGGCLLAGCGQKKAVSERENPPALARVEVLGPPADLPEAKRYPVTDVQARLDSPAAGSPVYAMELTWKTPTQTRQVAWGIVWRHGGSTRWLTQLEIPKGGPGAWAHGPFRSELSAGELHTLELRAITAPPRDDPDRKKKCPFVPDDCPLLKTVRVDLTPFK